jgi:hypothetical protein
MGIGEARELRRRADIPVRSKLRKAARSGYFPSGFTHRTLLRTGMSARRAGSSAVLRPKGGRA